MGGLRGLLWFVGRLRLGVAYLGSSLFGFSGRTATRLGGALDQEHYHLDRGTKKREFQLYGAHSIILGVA